MRGMSSVLGCASIVVVGLASSPVAAQDPATCPLHQQHTNQVRGEQAMGFSQARTTHHFRLSPRGGSIEVHVNAPGDHELREQVVMHLQKIGRQFSQGDFSSPLAVHGEEPAGVRPLQQFARSITYTFEAGELGGRVVISTGNGRALAAIHEFLRYQIREHRTGDPLSLDLR